MYKPHTRRGAAYQKEPRRNCKDLNLSQREITILRGGCFSFPPSSAQFLILALHKSDSVDVALQGPFLSRLLDRHRTLHPFSLRCRWSDLWTGLFTLTCLFLFLLLTAQTYYPRPVMVSLLLRRPRPFDAMADRSGLAHLVAQPIFNRLRHKYRMGGADFQWEEGPGHLH